jgi:selenide,water dikinase
LPGATAAFSSGVRSSLHGANEQALLDFKVSEAVATDPRLSALVDPQTSGGLLAAVPSDKASQCIAALHEAGFLAASVVGEFCEASRLEIRR